MRNFSRLLSFAAFAASASAAAVSNTTSCPNTLLNPVPANNTLTLDGTNTDTDTIASTAQVVDQKTGATNDIPPGQPPPPTAVTAVDGELTNTTVPTNTTVTTTGDTRRAVSKRSPDDYEVVFQGTGVGLTDRDGSIEGTAYLTYTLVPNSTYNVDACLDFCDSVEGCVFANLYYEFNNALLDWVFSEKSNLKCAVYADIHTAAEKTNMGGQQLEPPPAGLVYIQDSSGYAAKTLVDPADPEGYQLVFGPTNGANNAPGYMGFAFIDKYDVDACAALCNTRGPDSNGGACQYFNIWRAVVNGIPTTYTCSFYYLVADESTAVNTGQGNLQVTYSRGYKRLNLIQDPSFEAFAACDASSVCWTESTPAWTATSSPGGNLDAEIIHHEGYAHSGSSAGLLGSGFGSDSLPGTITPASPLNTVAGKTYLITFFQSSSFSGPDGEANAFIDVMWNGQVIDTIDPGFSDWTYYQTTVVAIGNDVLAFHGGEAPAWSFIDDIYVFLA